MKRYIAALLAAVLLAACVSALAEDPTLDSYIPKDIVYGDVQPVYDLQMNGHAGMWSSFWYENGQWNFDNTASESGYLHFNTLGHDGVVVGKEKLPYVLYVAGETFSTIKDAFYASYVDEAEPYVRLFREDDMDYLFEEIEKLFRIDDEGNVKIIPPIVWYSSNTVCVAGLEFREVKPSLTSKWYNFAPIDLSVDGKQVFELVASNMYVVGTVTVDKQGDTVTVNWALNKQGTVDANFVSESEFFTFFHDIDSVTGVEPAQAGSSFSFGKPISISEDLDGDTNLLLYVRNTATYCNNLSYKYQNLIYQPRYDRNNEQHRGLRADMLALMDLDQAN